VVGGNLESPGSDEEEDIVMFPEDLDIGLIACTEVINRSLTGEVEAVTIEGSGSRVVQHGLIRDRDGKDGPKDESRLSCAQGERDVKGQDQAKNMRSVVNGPQIDGRWFGLRESKLMGLVVILPVLVGELKLRTPFFCQGLFTLVELVDFSYSMETGIITAFIESHIFSLFPGGEGVLAVGAVVLGLVLAESFFLLKEFAADLAEELGSLLAVVVVEVVMGCLAAGAAGGLRDPRGAGPVFYGG